MRRKRTMKMEKNHILSSSLTNYLHASASMSCCNLAAPRLMPWFASTISQSTPHCLPAFFSETTQANLTLMALGSSAPEILLSIIEVLNKRFFAGALGPSTIVGSASFNLLVIIAICKSFLSSFFETPCTCATPSPQYACVCVYTRVWVYTLEEARVRSEEVVCRPAALPIGCVPPSRLALLLQSFFLRLDFFGLILSGVKN